MPKILTDLVKKLEKEKKVKNPWAVAISTLKKANLIEYSKKGKDWVLAKKENRKRKNK